MLLTNKFFFLAILSTLFFSCDSKQVFDSYKNVSNTWHKDSIIQFNITPPDSLNTYNAFVNIRNTNEYKYSNLFLIVEMQFPHGKTVKDTLEYKMADPSGKLLGAGLGTIKENKLWYKEHIKFPEKGTYKVSIQQAMRENGKVNGLESLDGIVDVGFRIEHIK